VPFDRPVIGYGGSTINTLRLWAAAAPDYFNFEEFSHGDFVEAFTQTLSAETLTRVLYPDDSDFRSYLEADERLRALYADPDEWARKAILNVAGSGKFSSDRTLPNTQTKSGTCELAQCPKGRR